MLKINKNKFKSCFTHIKARHISQLQSLEECSSLDAKSIISDQIKCPSKIKKSKRFSKTAVLDKLDQTIGGTPTNEYVLLSSPHYQAGNYNNAKQNKLEYKKKGIEVAEYVIGKFPDLFTHDFDSDNKNIWIGDVSQPKEFIGLDEYENECKTNQNNSNTDSNASKLDLLKQSIELGHFDDAVSYYEQLEPEKQTTEITNMLLAHICFYCGSSEIKKKYDEFPFSLYIDLRSKGNFKLVEKMFRLIDNPTNEQYCVYIRSLSKLRMGDEGMQVYNNKLKKEMLLDNDTISCLFELNRHASKQNKVKISDLSISLQKKLNDNNLLPNDQIFSSVFFRTVGHLNTDYKNKFNCFMNELHACNVYLTPSLFYQMIYNVINNKSQPFEIVDEALDYLLDFFESYENLKCSRPIDTNEYTRLLIMFAKHDDLKRCKRLYEIVCNNRGKRDILKNIMNEARFYSTYYSVLIKLDTITNAWEAKRSLTPKKFSFTSVHVKLFFDAVVKNSAFEYIPIIAIYMLRDRDNNYKNSLEVFKYIVENFESIAKYDDILKEKGDTFLQIKNMCIISLRNPHTFLSPSTDLGYDKIRKMQDDISNYSLQFISKSSDFVSIRNMMEIFAKCGFTLKPETLKCCELAAKKNPRLEDYVKRLKNIK